MKPKTKIFGIDTKEAYRKVMAEPEPSPEDKSKNQHSSIEDKADFQRVDNVLYRNTPCSVDLAKALLDSGNKKTQDEWAEYSRQAKQQNRVYTGNFQLYHALFSQLHNLREVPAMRDIAEEARQFISSQMLQKYLTTLTRLQYKATGDDIIIHDYGMPDEFKLRGNIVGKDGLITDVNTNAQGMLELLTGENNIAKGIAK